MVSRPASPFQCADSATGIAVSEERVDDKDIEVDENDEAPKELRCAAEETDGAATSAGSAKTNAFWSKAKSAVRQY